MNIIGIDPGKSGAMVLICSRGEETIPAIEIYKFSGMTDRDICDAIGKWSMNQDLHCYIEKVHAIHGSSANNTWKFAGSYFTLKAFLIALKIPFEEVSPVKWQKVMGCLSKGDKNVTKAAAQRLFPDIKITHAIADALLIAEYGRRIKK
jgi:hypothetical protein